jgi:hypothetical protein
MRVLFVLLTCLVSVTLLAQTEPRLGGIPLIVPGNDLGTPRDTVGGIPLRVPTDRQSAGMQQNWARRPASDLRAPDSDYAVDPSLFGYYPTWKPTQAQSASEYDRTAAQYTPGSRSYANPYFLTAPLVPTPAVWNPVGQGGQTTLDVHPFARSAYPPDAELKLGPLYVDLQSAELTMLYSDYNGPSTGDVRDGFDMALGLNFGIYLQIGRSTYITGSGSLYYLPLDGAVGFLLGSDTSIFLSHWMQLGSWDVTIYDSFDVYTPLDAFNYGTDEGATISGRRYALGAGAFADRPFSEDQLFYRNTAGITAGTYIAPDVRLNVNGSHTDIWDHDLNHSSQLDQIGTGLFYDSRAIWFAPYITYDAYFVDGQFDEPTQIVNVGATFPFSRSLTAYASVGYLWREADDGADNSSVVWNATLIHRINSCWTQSLNAGYSYLLGDLLEEFQGYHYSYSLNYSQPGGLAVGAFVQWASNDLEPKNEAWVSGLYSSIQLDRRTNAGASVYYYKETSPIESNSWLYQVYLQRVLTPTVYATLRYQYNDYNATDKTASFDESLILLTITKNL